jgi:hypothetical protein
MQRQHIFLTQAGVAIEHYRPSPEIYGYWQPLTISNSFLSIYQVSKTAWEKVYNPVAKLYSLINNQPEWIIADKNWMALN